MTRFSLDRFRRGLRSSIFVSTQKMVSRFFNSEIADMSSIGFSLMVRLRRCDNLLNGVMSDVPPEENSNPRNSMTREMGEMSFAGKSFSKTESAVEK